MSQSSENHFLSFAQIGDALHREYGSLATTSRRSSAPRDARLQLPLCRVRGPGGAQGGEPPGRYQFFALDWIIEENGQSYLLEGNGNPSIREYDETGLTPVFWESMLELEELIHAHPEDLSPGAVLSVRQRFAYKGWRLTYNQLEVAAAGEQYNPCKFNEYAATKHPLFGFAPA